MTREHDEQSHAAPHRGKVATHEALFSVCGAPLAWLAQLSLAFAFSTTPCFLFGERLLTHAGVQPWPLILSIACLIVAIAALWLGIVLWRRTRGETGSGPHKLVEPGRGRTRFLAIWSVASAGVFVLLIAANIVMLLAFPICAR